MTLWVCSCVDGRWLVGDLLLRRHGALGSWSVGIVCVTGRATEAILGGIHGETGG